MPSKPCTDHLGNKFDSITDMCQHWNINIKTFREKQKQGWSLEKSLCEKIDNSKSCIDHLGNKFNSITKMCQHWNIDRNLFQYRQKLGWSLEESLCGKKVTDHLENKFDSEKDMCGYWNINQTTFRFRQKQGWSLPESLGIIPKLNVTKGVSKVSFQNYQLTSNITIIDNVPDTNCYFICLINNEDKTIYHRKELIDEYIKYNKKQRK